MSEIWKPSVTVAAVIEQDGRFLLVEEETADGLRFNQPAGHLDPGESPQAGAVREALEETAWEFLPQAFQGVYLARSLSSRTGGEVTYLRLAFSGVVGRHFAERKLDDGIVRAVWMTPDEVRACQARHRSPLVRQCMEDYLVGQRYPLELVFTHASADFSADPGRTEGA